MTRQMNAGRVVFVAGFILPFEIGLCAFDFITTGSFLFVLKKKMNTNTSTNRGYNKGFKKTKPEPYQQRVNLSEL